MTRLVRQQVAVQVRNSATIRQLGEFVADITGRHAPDADRWIRGIVFQRPMIWLGSVLNDFIRNRSHSHIERQFNLVHVFGERRNRRQAACAAGRQSRDRPRRSRSITSPRWPVVPRVKRYLNKLTTLTWIQSNSWVYQRSRCFRSIRGDSANFRVPSRTYRKLNTSVQRRGGRSKLMGVTIRRTGRKDRQPMASCDMARF